MNNFIKNSLSPGDAKFKASVGLFMMRLTFGGLMFFNHGLAKLAKDADSLPNPLNLNPSFSGYLILFSEVFCAALLVLGLASRWAAAILSLTMAVAFFVFHEASLKEGELAVTYLSAYIALLIIGPGSISIDKFISKK